MPVSPVIPSVKPRSGQRRVLLLTSESALEAEVRDALRIRQQEREPGLFFELTYVDPALFSDFLGVLDLLDHVRSGYFDMVHIVPSAATWSRSRHSTHSGQLSLRSRSSPLGLPSLSPLESEQINKANRALEVAAWVAQQSLQCPSKLIGLNIIFPEDLGGHREHGPSSMWVLREFRLLEGVRDARRAAAYLCQFTRSEYKRAIGIFSSSPSLSVLYCFRDGLSWLKLRTVLHIEALCLFPVPVAMSTSLLLVCRLTLLFAPPLFLGLELISWLPLSMMVYWKGVSIPLGMAIDLISLLWASLHSSLPRWLPHRLHYALLMRRGRLVRLRRHRWWILLLRNSSQFIFLPHTALLWALHLVRVCAHFGRCHRFCLLLPLPPALLLPLLPRLRRSVHCARDHAHLVV